MNTRSTRGSSAPTIADVAQRSGFSPMTVSRVVNGDMAAAVVTVAHRRHRNVQCDLTVIGFDATDFARSIWPELTTIRQPIARSTMH